MIIYDFDYNSDTINFKLTHPELKHYTLLKYTKPNSTAMIITVSESSSILLTPFSGDISQIKFVFDAPSCYLKCNDCKTED